MMLEALSLAEIGWGRVSPNPLVGAVVVKGDRVVGRGYHAEYGAPHAEVQALGDAGGEARGATMFVNLEPCAHRGKTPPCTDAIVAAGIGRVVIGCIDPNPLAAGGAAALRGAGVEVEFAETEQAIRLNAPFLWSHLKSSPWIELKLALSADDMIAARPGERTPITGAETAAEVHRLRAGFDAILIGSETADVDDPLLTVRGDIVPRRPPVRVVLDGRLRLPLDGRLVKTAPEIPTWVVTTSSADQVRRSELLAAGVRVLPVPTDVDGMLPPPAVTRLLWSEGLRSLLIEGGARVAASFLAAGLVRRLRLFRSPRTIGLSGVPGFPAGRGPGPWREVRREAYGIDTLREFDHVPTFNTLAEGS